MEVLRLKSLRPDNTAIIENSLLLTVFFELHNQVRLLGRGDHGRALIIIVIFIHFIVLILQLNMHLSDYSSVV